MEIDTEKKWKKRIGKFSPGQLEMIVSFMEQNSNVAQGKLTMEFSKFDRKKKWEELSAMLNAEGYGPRKTSDQWRKTWNDQKALIRCKAVKIKNNGNIIGPYGTREKLTPIEERLLNIVGFISSTGDNDSSELTFSSMIETSVDTVSETILPDQSTESTVEPILLNTPIEPKVETVLLEPSESKIETVFLVKSSEPVTKTVLQLDPLTEPKREIVLPEQQTQSATSQQTSQNCLKRPWNDAERRTKKRKKETDALLAAIKEQNETLKEISSHLRKRNMLLENQNEWLNNVMENQNLLISKLLEKI